MLLHCSHEFGSEILTDGQLSDRFHMTVANETPFLGQRYSKLLNASSRPSLDSIWSGKDVQSMEELQSLCDESIKLMGYWREHLGGSAVYVHSYDRKKRSHALRLINGDSAEAAARSEENVRPPRRQVLLPEDARLHFAVVKDGANSLGVVKTVKDVETRRAWKAGEKPVAGSFRIKSDEDTPTNPAFRLATDARAPTPPGDDAEKLQRALSVGNHLAVDAAVDSAHATIDEAMNRAKGEAEAEAEGATAAAAEKPPPLYAPDHYHPADDMTPAMAVAIAQPLGDHEDSHQSRGSSPVWGVISTPGVGKNARGGRGDPEEVMLLMELSKHVSNAKASIDRVKRTGGKEVDFSVPPPPVLPISLNPNRADGSLVMEFGPEIHWELETWDDAAVDLVQIFVLSRRDPRRVVRDCRLTHSQPATFAAKCVEEFEKIDDDEELLVMCSDSWRLGGAMSEAARVLQDQFGSQICSMDPSAFEKATPAGHHASSSAAAAAAAAAGVSASSAATAPVLKNTASQKIMKMMQATDAGSSAVTDLASGTGVGGGAHVDTG